jgi:transcriptional regulator with XRE-family HTH domain
MTCIRTLLAYNIKERRRILGISQEKLADKVSLSTQYISQIEQKHKFPSPDMLTRIAAALEIDTPQLFAVDPFSDEVIKQFHNGVMSDLDVFLTQTVRKRLSEMKNITPTKKRVSKKAKPK